jgi:ferric-dicitrate binding protein FerR (iron transport regulator)
MFENEATVRAAAQWFERLHEDASVDNLLAWHRWLDACARHRSAFRSLEDAWALAGISARFVRDAANSFEASDAYDGSTSVMEWRRARDCFVPGR